MLIPISTLMASEYLSSCMIPDILRIVLSYTEYYDRKKLNCPEDTGLYLNDVLLTQDNICDIDRMVSIVIDDVPLPYMSLVNLRKVTIIEQRIFINYFILNYQTSIIDAQLGEGWHNGDLSTVTINLNDAPIYPEYLAKMDWRRTYRMIYLKFHQNAIH